MTTRFGTSAWIAVAALGAAAWFAIDGSQRGGIRAASPKALSRLPSRSAAVRLKRPEPTSVASRSLVMPVASDAKHGSIERGDEPVTAVRVVRAVDGAPVPGARVDWFDEEADEAKVLEQDLLREASGWLTRVVSPTRQLRADASGRVRVPERGLLVATHEDRYGELRLDDLWFQDDEGPPTVRIARDRPLAVRVLDGARRAATGAELACYAVDADGARELVLSARADAAGRATFSHLAQRLAGHDVACQRVVVALAGLLEPPIEAVVELDSLPRSVALVRPETGRVEVEVLLADGSPWREPACVTLRSASESGASGTVETSAFTTDGQARFEQLQPGLPFSIGVVGPGLVGSSEAEPDRLHVPRYGVGHHVVTVEHDLPVTMRLVLPAGRALADRKVRLLASRTGDLPGTWEARTSADGVLELPAEGALGPAPGTLHLHVVASDHSGTWSAAAILPPWHRPQQRALGDLTLMAQAPLVTGLALGKDGPLVAAEFRVFASRGGCVSHLLWSGRTDGRGRYAAWFPRQAGESYEVELSAEGHRDARAVPHTLPSDDVLALEPKPAD